MWNSEKKSREQAGDIHRSVLRTGNLSFPHLRRVVARIEAGCRVFDAGVLLNDFSVHGCRLFSSVPLDPGAIVTVNLEQPRRVSVRARIVERRAPMRQGHIVSAHSFAHRLALEFLFSSEDECCAMAEFVAELGVVHGVRSTAPIGGVEFRGPFV